MNGMVKARLSVIGYDVQETDLPQIEYIELSTKEYIKNFCNVDDIPFGLTYLYIDMVCAEFLYQKKSAGGLGESFNFDTANAAITSITEGDVSVGLDTGESAEKKFDDLINSLRKPDISVLLRFRKLVW